MACKSPSRKLTDADVRSIFECLHHKAPIPPNLKFTIIPVGPSGQKFSPPSHEFEDGLYVLLKAAKKPKDKSKAYSAPQAPEHLQHLLWKEALPENCPWSLSGPQYSHQTAIQQRYCYPKGSPEYSRTKGGALWTMYNAEGKEDDEFRLLHVYYSVKRASNREGDRKKGRRKRAKRSPKSSPQSSPMRFGPPPMFHSPSTTTSSSALSLMYERSPMLSPQASVDLTDFWPRGDIRHQSYISPTINDVGNRSLGSRSFQSGLSGDLSMSPQGSHVSGHTADSMALPAMASPFRRPIHTDTLGCAVSPLQRTGNNHGPMPEAGAAAAAAMSDYSDLWNEPILSYDDDDNDEYSFSSQLQDVGSTIRERIRHAPAQEQSNLLTQMSDWARKLAEAPLTDNSMHQERQQQQVTSASATTEAPIMDSQCSI